METIMIQEADEATLDVVTTALEMEGYRVCSLNDETENALEMIRRLHPKLVLLDCWRSSYPGKQLSQLIKRQFPALAVVAFSCDNGIEEQYRQLGFDDFIKKPFDLDLFYRVVRTQLRQRREGTPELQTEGPLSEKDQQAMAVERARKPGEQALLRWHRLKQNLQTP